VIAAAAWSARPPRGRRGAATAAGAQHAQGPRDLLLMPDQMMLQIHESIGHPLELDRILGDERNYAGTSFVKAATSPPAIRLELLNVTFDPTIPEELASYSFDDDGTPPANSS
jgi:predicted Zn-dependent protease